MKSLIKKYIINLLAVYLISRLVNAVVISDNGYTYFYASLFLSLLLMLVKPVINLIMLPLNLLTLNMTSWLLNIIIVYVWIILSPGVSVSSWYFSGGNLGPLMFAPVTFPRWQVIILTGILLTLIIRFLNWLLK